MNETSKPWDETWHVVTRERDGKLRCMGVRGGREEDAVVETDSGFYPPSVAQAHLIAAAPDLYRALDAAHKCIEQMREWCLRDNRAKHATEYSHDVRWEALNALRKARGET